MDQEIIQFNERKGICRCGKVSFSKKQAQEKKNFLLKMGKEKVLRIYQCPMGDYWHLTKNTNEGTY